ncbi:MAG: helicase-exonuclease AddAB subunit AddA [bacterium]
MSKTKWTKEQLTAITTLPGNLLVSAAAGAGKTAVLVERVIRHVLNKSTPVDIDRLLIVTFTEAAATEMRQRIGAALAQALGERPGDPRLERQLALLNKADISTLHSFCLKIIRRYFYLLDLDPSFKVADEAEAALIERDVLEKLWEETYAKEASSGGPFTYLLDCYGVARSDDNLKELVLKLYHFSRSQSWPENWLQQAKSCFQVTAGSTLSDLPWGPPLLDYVAMALDMALEDIKEAIYYASLPGGPAKYLPCLHDEATSLEELAGIARCGSWENLRAALGYSFGRLSAIRKKDDVDPALKAYCTSARDKAKKIINDLKRDVFGRPEPELVAELGQLAPVMAMLVDLVLEFGQRFEAAKRALGRVDFADLEHYALRILREPSSTPDLSLPSAAARQLEEEYAEVLVDEYQDINPVQDAILNLISRQDSSRPNLFLVGDVKQSIYGFRLAEPKLFLHKYLTYPETAGGAQRRLTLTANFRSRFGILTAVNFLFRQLLTDQVGGLTYDRAAQLVPGAKYADPPIDTDSADGPVELHLVERQDESASSDRPDTEDQTTPASVSATGADLNALEKEALVIGRRIQAMIKGTAERPGPEFVVWDKEGKRYRPVMYRDIVILLRTMQGRANTMLEILRQLEIPAYADLGTGYFSAPEIQVVVSLLKIIDNPRQDIPLAAVLRSPLVGLSAVELAKIRLANPEGDYFQALEAAAETMSLDECCQKANKFLAQLDKWRTMARRRSLGELIWQIYSDTGYLTYVAALPAGAQRQANLRALYDRACQFESYGRPGLFRFLRFLERFQAQSGDLGTARALGENENVVRLMSIHKSKGLEFPVVFVADLGKKFNFQDLRGDIILHRDLGLGPMVVDLGLNVKYPSVAHRAVNVSGIRDTLAEELRIMYVAFTRAREKLVLVGSVANLKDKCRAWGINARRTGWQLPAGLLLSAQTYLDWLGPAVARHPDASALRQDDMSVVAPRLAKDPSSWQVCLYEASEFKMATMEAASALEVSVHPEELGKLLASKNPPPPELISRVEQALSWRYPYEKATSLAAKVSVSELKGRLTLGSATGEEDEGLRRMFQPLLAKRPRFVSGHSGLTAVEHGSAVHLVLEHLDISQSLTADDIKEQIAGMVERELLAEEAAQVIDAGALANFFAGSLGCRLKARPDMVRREVPFSLVLPAAKVYPEQQLLPAEGAEPILVQGIIDCLVQEENGWLLLDFKTDRASRAALTERLEGYRKQIQFYAMALSHLSPLPVAEAYIYFLSTGQAIPAIAKP